MKIDDLKLVCEIAKQGSFAEVARRRGINPSIVSRALSTLEQDLSVRLFQRSTRNISLTEAGEAFVGKILPILDELEFAVHSAREHTSQPAGLLRIGASVAFGDICLVPLLEALGREFPKLTIELHLSDRNVDLIHERIDLAIRLAPSVSGDLICSRLMDTRYHVCASPDYISNYGMPNQPGDLASRLCIVHTIPELRGGWIFKDKENQLTNVEIARHLAISSPLAIRSACMNGTGPALLADWMIQKELQAGKLIDLFPDHQVTGTTFDTAAWLLYPNKKYLPSKTRLVIEFLRERFAKL